MVPMLFVLTEPVFKTLKLYSGQRLYLGSSFNLDQQSRGKHSVAVNMKSPGGQQVIQDLSAKSDVILDPFRPGVMERLGCGPGRFIRKKCRY